MIDPKFHVISEPKPEDVSIPKPPKKFSLDKFKSKHSAAVANVQTLQTALPVHSIAQAKDFVRLHHDEDRFWSCELCFVNVPIKGMKRDTLHLIEENLAMQYLESARIQRFRLALATKPYDVFFLCHVPTQNTDNLWNESNLKGCTQAKTLWVQATSRRLEGVDAYKITAAQHQDAFPPPNWPAQSLDELIATTFNEHMIEAADHPGLLRLLGMKQEIS
jgi:hypothetical protein